MENIVVIVCDSLRRDKLSVYNDEVNFTENIESFAEEATVFEDAVAQAPWTLPSHSSIFTGMYPWNHGATQRNLTLNVDKQLLAERFSNEGYHTGCFSINGFLRDHSGLVKGFDQHENLAFGEGKNLLDKVVAKGEKWLAGERGIIKKWTATFADKIYHNWSSEMNETEKVISKGKEFCKEAENNFFLFMNLMDAHEPYRPPKKYRQKHTEKNSICQNPVEYYSGKKKPDFNEIHRHYNASVDYMDDEIGKFFSFLKKKQLWEDTTIVLISDHGQLLGENNHYGHQYSVHEKLISVPMIVKGGPEKDKVNSQVELRELYNLLPAWTGIDTAENIGVDKAKGGYEFPDMMTNRIPKNSYERLYKKKTFIRNKEEKTVKTEDEDGTRSFQTIELGTGREKDTEQELKKQLDSLDEDGVDESEKLEDKEEEVKEKLEALGYG
jgi:arylsulfatase A-like enzyme